LISGIIITRDDSIQHDKMNTCRGKDDYKWLQRITNDYKWLWNDSSTDRLKHTWLKDCITKTPTI
jgi:hypothetical protein